MVGIARRAVREIGKSRARRQERLRHVAHVFQRAGSAVFQPRLNVRPARAIERFRFPPRHLGGYVMRDFSVSTLLSLIEPPIPFGLWSWGETARTGPSPGPCACPTDSACAEETCRRPNNKR